MLAATTLGVIYNQDKLGGRTIVRVPQGGSDQFSFPANSLISSGTSSTNALVATSSITVDSIQATSTTATSTFAGNIDIVGDLEADQIFLLNTGISLDVIGKVQFEDDIRLVDGSRYIWYVDNTYSDEFVSISSSGVDSRLSIFDTGGSENISLDVSEVTSLRVAKFPDWGGQFVLSTSTTYVSSINATSTTDTSNFAGLVQFSNGFISQASSTHNTSLYLGNILNCDEALETDADGQIVCGTDATGGAGSYDADVVLTDNLSTTMLRASSTGNIWQFPDGFISNSSSTVNAILNVQEHLSASSTVSIADILTVDASATSTFAKGLSVDSLDIGSTASSTFGHGLSVESGAIRVTDLASCTGDVETDANGFLVCGTDDNSGGGGDPNVILRDDLSTLMLQASTSAQVWNFPNGFIASASSTLNSEFNIVEALSASSTVSITGPLTVDDLGSALVLTSTGKLTDYAGTSCTNEFVRSLSVLGVATCASVGSADITDGVVTEADLNIASVPPADNEILTYNSGGTNFDWHTLAELGIQAQDAVLDDLSALGVIADNEFIVGNGAGTYANESGATAVTSLEAGAINVILATEIDSVGELLAITDYETGTGALMFATSPTITTSVILGATGVSITDDADGAITFLGLGGGAFDENLIMNLDDTENEVVFSSGTGVATSTWTSIGGEFELLDIQSTTATSTFGNGLRIENGALALDQLLGCNGDFVLETDGSGNLQCGSDGGGAETNTLETTITGIEDREILLGDGTNSAIFTVIQACAADEKLEFTAGTPDTITCEAISGLVDADISNTLTASLLTVADTEDATTFVGLWSDATGDLAPLTDETLTYVANTGILTATGFTGAIQTAAQTNITSVGTLTALTVSGAFINSAGSLEMPNGTGITIDAAGEIGLDTTDNQLLVADSGNTARVFGRAVDEIWSVTVASTSPAFDSLGLLAIPVELDGYTIVDIRCKTDGTGTPTKVIAIEDAAANTTEDITCAETVTADDGTITNAVYTAEEESYIDFGASGGTQVDTVSISVFGYITAE